MGWSYVSSDEIQGYVVDSFLSKNKPVYDDYYYYDDENYYGFENYTELRKVYPNGVGSGHSEYQSKMDRDNDGWACEN